MLTITQNTTAPGVFARGPLMSDLLRFGVVFAPDDGTGSGGFEDDQRRDGQDTPEVEFDPEDAFLKTLRGADEATNAQPKEGTETDAETAATEDSEKETAEAEPAPEDSDAKDLATAGDDAIVEVKVGDETHKVPVKDLKRLFGQEAALTRRSQEVAAERETLRKDAERAKLVVSKALERAEAEAKPYTEMDFFKLSRTMDPEAFDQLRADAQKAIEAVQFLRSEADAADETLTRTARAATQAAAVACVKALQDPTSPHHVPEWSPKLYGELLQFASEQGYDATSVTDPAAIKLLHSAMRFERGRKVVAAQVKKVAEQPKKPLRPGSAGTANVTDREAATAVAQLRKTGSAEDAEMAFLARLRPRA